MKIIVPKIDEVDCSKLPNIEIAKFAVEKLLVGFSEFTQKEIVSILENKKNNKQTFVDFIKDDMFNESDFSALIFESGDLKKLNLQETAEAVVDLIFSILKESND